MLSKNTIKLVRSLQYKKFRLRERLFVAEGAKTVAELMTAFRAERVFISEETEADRTDTQPFRRRLSKETDCTIITHDELQRVSLLQHPQGVLALFRLPDDENGAPVDEDGLTLALDGVQDPGNMGTIIRTADWFGIRRVVCSRDSADAYAPKVVQATMGSLARVRVVYTDLVAFLAARRNGTPVYGTFLDGANIFEEHLSDNGIIIMGNEGNGISDAVARQVTHRLTIPRYSEHAGKSFEATGAESLNVAIATAVVCSEFRRAKRTMNETYK